MKTVRKPSVCMTQAFAGYGKGVVTFLSNPPTTFRKYVRKVILEQVWG